MTVSKISLLIALGSIWRATDFIFSPRMRKSKSPVSVCLLTVRQQDLFVFPLKKSADVTSKFCWIFAKNNMPQYFWFTLPPIFFILSGVSKK